MKRSTIVILLLSLLLILASVVVPSSAGLFAWGMWLVPVIPAAITVDFALKTMSLHPLKRVFASAHGGLASLALLYNPLITGPLHEPLQGSNLQGLRLIILASLISIGYALAVAPVRWYVQLRHLATLFVLAVAYLLDTHDFNL